MNYASDTSVSVARTRGEIEELVTRAGASRFFSGMDEGRAFVGFTMRVNERPCPDCAGPSPLRGRTSCNVCSKTGKVRDERNVMFELALPKVTAFARDGNGRARTDAKMKEAWEQGCRSAWRALFLCIKAKLVSVSSGVEAFEEAFLAQLMVRSADGGAERFGKRAVKAIAESYVQNGPPRLMLGSGS